MKYKLLLIFFMVFATLTGVAQDPTFTAQVSKTTVALNEQFEVSFTLNGNGKTFQPPSFRDFHVIMGPNQSSSMEFINGNMSQSISFSYVLQPKSEGTFKIGSAVIEAGKQLKTNPITITVTKASSSNSSQGQSKSGEPAADDGSPNLSENIFIKAIINKKDVNRGEALVVTYKLYTKISIVSFAPIKTPTFNGFWNQDIELPKETSLHKETLNGVEYNVADIKKTVLFPQRSGSLIIDPLEAESVVRVKGKRKSRSNDPFEDFFNDPFFGSPYQDYKQMLKSAPVKITVKDLPSGEPEGFTGAVGRFSMEAKLDRETTKSNEPVTLKIKISGKGNLKLIEPFKLQFPPDIETYDPKITEEIKVTEEGATGSKTFEYLLIPRHAGEYNIKPFNFSYFNIEKKQYTSLPSPEFVLKVEKGIEDNSANTANLSKEDIKFLGKDIRYIKTGAPVFKDKDRYFYGSGLFYSLLLAPALFFCGFLFYRKKVEKESADTLGLKSRRATGIAKKRLVMAHKYLKENNKALFYQEVSKAIWGYLSDKLSIPMAELSKEAATNALTKRNINNDLIQKTIATIDHSEYARYAPGGDVHEKESFYQDALAVITGLEENIK